MPSKRKQINVRTDQETEDRVQRLLPLVKQALGLEVSVSDLFRLGMLELERRYGPAQPDDLPKPAAEPAPPPKPRGRPKRAK